MYHPSYSLQHNAVIIFEFDAANYTVNEEGPAKQVCINQTSGQSSKNLTISVVSIAGAATGKWQLQKENADDKHLKTPCMY